MIAQGVMKRNFVHAVSDDRLMNQLGMVTKMAISRTLLLQLRDAGRAAMEGFLERSSANIGERSSIDLVEVIRSEGGTV